MAIFYAAAKPCREKFIDVSTFDTGEHFLKVRGLKRKKNGQN